MPPRQPEPRIEAGEPPQRASTPAAPAAHVEPVVFHAVSEHDAAAEEAHRPVRRRRPGQVEGQAQAELQLVETQAEVPVPAAALEDELPRRTKPRRRRGGPEASEPLKMVETQPGSEGVRPDGQQ